MNILECLKRRKRLSKIYLLFALVFLFTTSVYSVTPAEALQNLKDGNERFAAGQQTCATNLLQQLEESIEKQKPYAAILCCSDSRVPPELIFDESLGKLFIIRVAGNVATDVTIGSIEYAVAVLKVPLVVVLGHEACGVLEAALEGAKDLPPYIRDLVKKASLPAAEVKKDSKNLDNLVHQAVIKNVKFQMQDLLDKSKVLDKAVKKQQILFQGAVFHFQDGTVEWCPCK